MKKKGKVLSLVLSLALALGFLPWSVLPVRAEAQPDGMSAETAFPIGSWEELRAAVGADTEGWLKRADGESKDNPTWFRLAADCTGESIEDDHVKIAQGRYVVLDLAGHILNRNYADPDYTNTVLRVYGTLTLNDSEPDAPHEPAITYPDPFDKSKSIVVTGGVITGGGTGVGLEDVYGPAFTMNGGTITGNDEEGGNAGGVSVGRGTFNLNGGVIANNNSTGNSTLGYGGGVYCPQYGTMNMNGGAIVSNGARVGGGIFIMGGTLNINGGVIAGNTASSQGGGIYASKDYSTHSVINITDCSIAANTAGECGGGVYFYYSDCIMSGGVISGNRAETEDGGGVYNAGDFTMTGGTISGNAAQVDGGGLFNDNTVTMTGGCITGNTAGERGGGVFQFGSFYVGGKARVDGNHTGETSKDDNVYCFYSERAVKSYTLTAVSALTAGALLGVTMAESPLFGVFARGYADEENPENDYTITGGDCAHFTSDDGRYCVALNEKSEALLTAPAAAGSWEALQTALESGGAVALSGDVTAGGNDTALRVPADKFVTLDLAGHTLDRGLGGETEPVSGGCAIRVYGALTLRDSAGNGKITGGNMGNEVQAMANGGGVCVYGGAAFTMTGGAITGCIAGNNGGGVFVSSGTFTMTDGEIADCRANNCGGGVYAGGSGKVMLAGGTIRDNEAKYGGGAYAYFDETNAATYGSGSLTLSGVRVSGNTAGMGGGLYAGFGGENASLTMTGGAIVQNTATAENVAKPDGGGVELFSGSLVMTGGEIDENSADEYGGGVHVRVGARFVLSGGSITGNAAEKYGGGVFVGADKNAAGAFTLSGASEIAGNTVREGADNVSLCRDGDAEAIITVSGALSGTPVGVRKLEWSADEDDYVTIPGVFAEGDFDAEHNPEGHKLTGADLAHFTSEDEGFMPALNADGRAELQPVPVFGVSGLWNDEGALTASLSAPADSLLIAAAYDANGRQTAVRCFPIEEQCMAAVPTGLNRTDGVIFKLMLADRNFAPLCELWQSDLGE